MIELVAILTLLLNPEAEALRRTAPDMLDLASAADHLAAARAAAAPDLDPDLLLAIAHHESNYQHQERTRRADGMVACGVMTPEPTRDVAACDRATSSLEAGYRAGADHLRAWVREQRTTRRALLGYAGGHPLIAACSPGGAGDPRCVDPDVFLSRARTIREARAATKQGARS